MGTNASGKTSLGKILWGIQMMFANHFFVVSDILYDTVCDDKKPAQVIIEFVLPNSNEYVYFFVEFLKNGKITNIEYSKIYLNKNDSNVTAKNRL